MTRANNALEFNNWIPAFGEDDNVEAGEDDGGEGSENSRLDPRPFAVILGLAPGIQ